MTYLHIDLCAGLGGWQQPFQESDGWRSVGVDIEPKAGADVLGDVRELPLKPVEPELLTMSPPCTEFSLARHPKIPPSEADYSVWRACERAVERLQPEWWVIENVRGAIRHMGPPTASHKPYYLWGEFPPIDPGPMPRKTKPLATGNTTHNADEAAKIPYPLADALRKSVEWYL